MRMTLLIALTLIAGCYDSDPFGAFVAASPDLEEPFQLRVGQWAEVADGDLWVRFLEVAGDSRCPSDALILCVWEGEGIVVVEWAARDAEVAQTDTVRTRPTVNTAEMGEWVLELQRLDPYPATTEPIPWDEYVATFVVRTRQ